MSDLTRTPVYLLPLSITPPAPASSLTHTNTSSTKGRFGTLKGCFRGLAPVASVSSPVSGPLPLFQHAPALTCDRHIVIPVYYEDSDELECGRYAVDLEAAERAYINSSNGPYQSFEWSALAQGKILPRGRRSASARQLHPPRTTRTTKTFSPPLPLLLSRQPTLSSALLPHHLPLPLTPPEDDADTVPPTPDIDEPQHEKVQLRARSFAPRQAMLDNYIYTDPRFDVLRPDRMDDACAHGLKLIQGQDKLQRIYESHYNLGGEALQQDEYQRLFRFGEHLQARRPTTSPGSTQLPTPAPTCSALVHLVRRSNTASSSQTR
ncbi:hypothetical protein JCM11641_002264 [Rhodosporidiobolus odoratus]